MINQNSETQIVCARWSNRFLLVSLLGIACLTLFPFHFSSVGRPTNYGHAFLLGTTGKNAPPYDILLNILLFVPFGFALSVRRNKRGGSRWTTLVLALLAGAIVSYTVELLQFYIPMRNSGWDDVPPNTIGSGVGFFMFEFCGVAILGLLSKAEDALDSWLSSARAAALLLAYFALWSGIAISLQRQTWLRHIHSIRTNRGDWRIDPYI